MALLRFEKHAILFLLRHLAYGVAGGLAFGAMCVALDIAHLRSLATQSSDGVLALGLFFFGLIVTFGSIGMGVGIMSLGKDEN